MPVRAPASSSFDWYRVNVRHAASVAPVNRKRAIIGHLHGGKYVKIFAVRGPPTIQGSLLARNVQIRTELYRTQCTGVSCNGDKFAPNTVCVGGVGRDGCEVRAV